MKFYNKEKKIAITIIVLCVLAVVIVKFCVKRGSTVSVVEKTEQRKYSYDHIPTDSVTFIFNEYYTYTCENGHKRSFGDISNTDGYYKEVFVMCDEQNKNFPMYIKLTYLYYDLEPTDVRLSHYLVSIDKKNIYIVTRKDANSDGWTSEYQLFKVDCETLEGKFICDCAAIEATSEGFTIAVARLTNSETAVCVADEIWVMHDVYLDWNGDVKKVSKHEYSYDVMEKKYQQGEYTFVKGFLDVYEKKNIKTRYYKRPKDVRDIGTDLVQTKIPPII